jgi:hypothetical protein
MLYREARFILLAMTLLAPASVIATQAAANGRSFEECQKLAISRGVPSRYTDKVFHKYERYKAAGTAINPKGLIARCMAGTY